ncbi:MAG: helix-turn-helix transcriptional regulator, partial [Bacteroidaceae bacterium]|nr:helix-turn-helix transcriptional regulator [Bacteroidaceae bacterium]
LSVDELASIACITKNYFIQLFTHTLGMSPVRYINRKKIERAQLMLLTEQVPVKEVAYRLGFSDHSYFIRLFRQTVGITPQEYRKRNGRA